ncbi:oxidoreductase domain protein [Asticcacaulis biprosthecium C19]|uniref:Oxidoreductase domain protein n=1 Tax=Asticcacaulis biprosthecium C19 TaxID=715226 RepID=F4QQ00_9CAUL|nr:oxidoreductase [Asticcacaulis biprosthecium]EGF90287.1 oxidoreductase domain protein [Asticcacaulis biprosthecium C19]
MINTALIGFGYAGKTIHSPLIRAAQGLDLTTIVSSRPDDVHADLPGMRVTTFDEALADPNIQLVVIATPNDLHAPQAHAALNAGKHVVIDKPFCLTVSEGEALVDHARRADRVLSVFHCRRWDSNFLTFSRIRDRLGDPYQVVLRYDRWRPEVRDRWRERDGPGSGIWFDLGSHLIDQALSQFGWPEAISADIAPQRPDAQTDDFFHTTLFYGPLRVILHSSMLTLAVGPAFEVQGSNGAFVKYGMDPQEDMLKAGRTPGDDGWGGDRDGHLTDISGNTESIASVPGNYLAYYEAIARAIADGAHNPVPAGDALKVMQVIEAGFRSAREGRRVAL